MGKLKNIVGFQTMTEESQNEHHLFYSNNIIALEGFHDKDIIVDFWSLKPLMKLHEVVSKIQTNFLFTINNCWCNCVSILVLLGRSVQESLNLWI